MKPLLQTILLSFFSIGGYSQDFFWPDFDPNNRSATVPFPGSTVTPPQPPRPGEPPRPPQPPSGNTITFSYSDQSKLTGPLGYGTAGVPLHPEAWLKGNGTTPPPITTSPYPIPTTTGATGLGIFSIFPVITGGKVTVSFKEPVTTGFYLYILQTASDIVIDKPFELVSQDGDLGVGGNSIIPTVGGNHSDLPKSPDDANALLYIHAGITELHLTLSDRNKEEDGVYFAFAFPTPKVELIGLEVTQVIQDWQNSISLIENKKTIVRAHLQSTNAASVPVVGKLFARDFSGTELPGSPLIVSFSALPQAIDEKEIKGRRYDIGSSLNFELPTSWTTGTIELELVSENGIVCKEVSGSCKATVTFSSSKILELKFFAIDWKDKNDGDKKYAITNTDAKDEFFELENEILALYPISKIDRAKDGRGSIGRFNFIGPPLEIRPYGKLYEIINNKLERAHPINDNRLYLAVIDGPAEIVVGIPSISPLGKVLSIPGGSATVHRYSDVRTSAHELGHLLGRQHAVYCMPPEPGNTQPFPKDNEFVDPFDGVLKGAIGPMNKGINRLIYGYYGIDDYVISPEISFELMSYCFPQWISDFTYQALITAINDKFPHPASFSSSKPIPSINKNNSLNSAATLSTYQLFSGTISLDADHVKFDPVILKQSNTTPILTHGGEYELQLQDENNNIVKTVNLEPKRIFKENPPNPKEAFFITHAVLDLSVKKAVILKNNVVIGEKAATTNVPTIKLISPNGGEILKESTATITWEADDADGDALTYVVQFSNDGGTTWEILDIDLPDKTYEADVSLLGKTQNGLIRVMASDGFNVAMDESDSAFSTPNSVPDVFIRTPTKNHIFTGEELIIFRGSARDVEDDNLPGTALHWSSNVDGFLGNGEDLNKLASQLKEGEHIITLTATDKEGASTSSRVKITIQRVTSPTSGFTLICPKDLVVANNPSQCDALVAFTATTTGTPTVVYKLGTTVITSPHSFPIGTTTVSVVASNGVDTDATCSFSIVVTDTEKPALTCPAMATLCYNTSGSYSIAALEAVDNCGIQSYSYTITGATLRSGKTADASGIFNLGTSIIEWTVTDLSGNINTCQTTVVVNQTITVSIPDARVLQQGVDLNTVYFGYPVASSITMRAEIRNEDDLTYLWSTGATSPSVIVSPAVSATYSVTVTNKLGCIGTASKEIKVVDVRCGNKLDKVKICKVSPGNSSNNKENCIAADAVEAHLTTGSYLGPCKANTNSQHLKTGFNEKISESTGMLSLSVKAVPNPTNRYFTLAVTSRDIHSIISLKVLDNVGKVVEVKRVFANQTFQIGSLYRPGLYFAEIIQGKQKVIVKLIKHNSY